APGGLGGLAVETTWCAAHLACYPWGLVPHGEPPGAGFGYYRTERLSPTQRALLDAERAAHQGHQLLRCDRRRHPDFAGARVDGQPLGVRGVTPGAAPSRVRGGARR